MELADLWHRRLAHQNRKSSRELVKQVTNLNITSKQCTLCSSCQFGKAHHQSIPKMTKFRAAKPLELIHSDVGGPLPVRSHSHATMYVLFIDDATRYMQVYFIKSKEEVLSKFIEFVTAAELKFDTQQLMVKALRCDSGTEYLNKAFFDFAASKGIQIEPSPPYTHECNGVAERANRTLLEAARSMLFDAGLPPSFWAEAVSTAVYVRNRSFTQALKKPQTPWSAWNGEPTNLSNLRAFGSLVYVVLEQKDTNKLQHQAATGVFVGYTADKQTYRVFMHHSNTIHVTRHLTFDESVKGWRWTPIQQPTNGSMPPSSGMTLSETSSCNPPSSVETDISTGTQAAQRSSTRNRKPVQPHWHMHPDRRANMYAYAISAEDSPETAKLHQSTQLPLLSVEPLNLTQAMQRDDWPHWLGAIESELSSLHKAKVWDLVPPPQGCNIVGCRPVFKIKRLADGTIDRYKVRYVAQGYNQVEGVDFNETFAPVAKTASIRAMLALAAWHDLHVHQMDVETAFLNGDLDCPIYMRQPPGSIKPGTESLVCLLKKSIYGLKQSGRVWYQKMHDSLVQQHGFEAMQGDHCVYRRDEVDSGSVIWIALYVDDLLIMGNKLTSVKLFKQHLATTFSMKDLGVARYILGIQIHRDLTAGTLTITQSAYIKALTHKFGMEMSRPISTPMEVKHGLSHSQSPITRHEREAMRSTPYLSAVGGIMYAMTSTRPDLAYAVAILSQFGNNPGTTHWIAVKRVLQYMNCTADVGITYRTRSSINPSTSKAVIHGFCDADWASNPDNRRSITGYIFLLACGAVSWAAKSQPTVALSTVEAEYMSYCMAAREAVWWRQLLNQLYYNPTTSSSSTTSRMVPLPATVMYADNQGAIALSKNPEFHQRTKHISVIWHWIREKVTSKELVLEYLSTHKMAADFLTKSLPREAHLKCCVAVGLA